MKHDEKLFEVILPPTDMLEKELEDVLWAPWIIAVLIRVE